MNKTTRITKWGNSCGVRIPAAILKEAGMQLNETVCVDSNTQGHIVISLAPLPKRGTIEYLFKDYDGGSFRTELVDLGEPEGEEKW
jgi:antitoxin MazE